MPALRPCTRITPALPCLPNRVALAAAPTVQQLVDQFSMTNYFNVVSNKLYTRQGMNRAPLERRPNKR